MVERYRPNWLEIDLDAIEANATLLARAVAPSALCAVVKADGYGHGAVDVALAALAGGASWLAVALVEEGVALRDAGIDAPVLLLSEPSADGIVEALHQGLTLTLYTRRGVEQAVAAVVPPGVGVHVKVDTGMHRVGASPAELGAVLEAIGRSPHLEVTGLWSHLAVADDPSDPRTAGQLELLEALYLKHFDPGARQVRRPGPRARLSGDARLGQGLAPAPLLHLANSAGAIMHPATRLDLVRCGIALYGYAPPARYGNAPPAPRGPVDDHPGEGAYEVLSRLRPAMSWKAEVHLVRELDAGEAVSYGLSRPLMERSNVAVVPAGYHDGVPRRLFDAGGAVLIQGQRCPIAGQVTMDQLIVDCGPRSSVKPGDEVVLLGSQGGEQISADEWATRLETISYEVLCGIGPRVPRVSVHSAARSTEALRGS